MSNAILWPLSMTQINDVNGKPYIGAKARFYEGDTNDDIASGPWTDKEMTVAHPNPVLSNGFGMWPVVFLDGTPPTLEGDPPNQFYGLRITDAAGVQLVAKTVLPVGGPPIDTSQEIVGGDLLTGDLQASYLTGNRNGYVRANGMTIGDASSGATERANLDCEALFELLWNLNKEHFKVGDGEFSERGASAANDWAAHKKITLPDLRGRTIVGRNTMGASAASGALDPIVVDDSGTDFNGTANADADVDVVGSHGGNDRITLERKDMPAHRHEFTDAEDATVRALATTTLSGEIGSGGSAHKHRYDTWSEYANAAPGSASSPVDKTNLKSWFTDVDGAHTHQVSGINAETVLDLKMTSVGGDVDLGGATRPHKNMMPYGIITYYIKL